MKFVFFLKYRLIFKIFYCFCMFLNKHFINAGVYISERKQFHNAKPSTYYFYMKTKIPFNFRICIRVPLMLPATNRVAIYITIQNTSYNVWGGHPRNKKKMSVIDRCPLYRSLRKLNTFFSNSNDKEASISWIHCWKAVYLK